MKNLLTVIKSITLLSIAIFFGLMSFALVDNNGIKIKHSGYVNIEGVDLDVDVDVPSELDLYHKWPGIVNGKYTDSNSHLHIAD